MIRKILVPTDGSEFAITGEHYAVALAKQYKATLHAVHIVDIRLLEGPFLRDISASLGVAPYVNYQGNIAMILEERGNAALKGFAKACQEAGIVCETSLVTGVVARSIIEMSELVDLIVMGRGGEHGQWLDGVVGSTTAAVVRGAGRPVLVTGSKVPGNNLFVVAYDGSSHAKKALQSAANIGTDWKIPFHVLAVGDGKRTSLLLQEAQSYLEAHEITVDYVAREGDPSEMIISYAKECNADLIVMGAYGHTKVRELVVGSTTAYVLNHTHCPLLLAR